MGGIRKTYKGKNGGKLRMSNMPNTLQLMIRLTREGRKETSRNVEEGIKLRTIVVTDENLQYLQHLVSISHLNSSRGKEMRKICT